MFDSLRVRLGLGRRLPALATAAAALSLGASLEADALGTILDGVALDGVRPFERRLLDHGERMSRIPADPVRLWTGVDVVADAARPEMFISY